MDLDIDSEMHKIDQFAENHLKDMEKNSTKVPIFSNDNQKKCFYCNEYKNIHKISIIAYSFPVIIANNAGFRIADKRRQICVSNNHDINIIGYTKI